MKSGVHLKKMNNLECGNKMSQRKCHLNIIKHLFNHIYKTITKQLLIIS